MAYHCGALCIQLLAELEQLTGAKVGNLVYI